LPDKLILLEKEVKLSKKSWKKKEYHMKRHLKKLKQLLLLDKCLWKLVDKMKVSLKMKKVNNYKNGYQKIKLFLLELLQLKN